MTADANLLGFFASVPRGLSELLAIELEALDIKVERTTLTGVAFSGSLRAGYTVCMHSRLANRVLLRLAHTPAENETSLYDAAYAIPWPEHFEAARRFNVAFSGRGRWLNNTHFGALKVKDAVVDRFRSATGVRPDVELREPDLRIHAHLHRDWVELSLEITSAPMFLRQRAEDGGRVPAVAPLKENLAAAVLIRAGWPELARSGAPLLDPMCGSGTLLREGLLMAADIAPGLVSRVGLSKWLGQDPELWAECVDAAQTRAHEAAPGVRSDFIGHDANPKAINAARDALDSMGFADRCFLSRAGLESLTAPDGPPGLICTNPPYGVRMGAGPNLELADLYALLGDRMRGHFPGWKVGVLCATSSPASEMRLSRARRYKLFNGAIECELICASLFAQRPHSDALTLRDSGRARKPEAGHADLDTESRAAALSRAADFANRLRKNLRRLGRWARRNDIRCYRLYDADLPEYALAIDVYQSEQLLVHAQEYAPPDSISPAKARERREDALTVVQQVLEVSSEQLFVKRRERQRGAGQYRRLDHAKNQHEVREGDSRLLVNLRDFLDTGLFLDHRPLRARITAEARNKRFLNLFAYTGSASVAAYHGGAHSSVSVDSSKTYCDWALANLRLNDAPQQQHRVECTDCRTWLDAAAAQSDSFDLVFLDPPTFSNSKSGRADFDVQRDHGELIDASMRLLTGDGVLYFSTNLRRFKLDVSVDERYDVEDITPSTIGEDFARRPKVHKVFRLKARAG